MDDSHVSRVESALFMNAISKPRLLVVISTLDLGGAEKHLLTILPHLLDTYDITIYTTSHRGLLESQFIQQGIRIVGSEQKYFQKRNLMTNFFVLAKRLLQITLQLHRESYDVIHFFLPGSYLLGGVAAVMLNKKHLIMSRRSQNDYQKTHLIATIIEKWLHHRMTFVVGNSEKVIGQLREEGVTQQQLRLIYNGISLSDVREDSHSHKDDSISPFILTIIANLYFYKGHADLLHALALIKDRLPDNWQLLCVGRDAGELNKLTVLADSLGLASHIQWLGQRLDIPELTAMSDIGLLVSHEEGFSNAILEFMAAGKPVVVTDVGGNAEAIIDGVCGLVVPAKDYTQLADAILMLASDKNLRLSYGDAARQRAVEHFSLEQCVSQYNELYKDVLAS